jgi:uncharacterized protein YggE
MQQIQYQRDKSPFLVVHGEGIVKASPDTARIVVGARTENENLQKAQEENADRIEGIRTVLHLNGIRKEEIQTTDYRIETVYHYADGKQTFAGYLVLHLLAVTVLGPEKAGAIVDMAVKNGANEVSGITFSSSKSQNLYLNALSLALTDARVKAETIARAFRAKLRPVPISVIEAASPPAQEPFLKAAFDSSSTPSTQIEMGSIQVRASVEVKYTYY